MGNSNHCNQKVTPPLMQPIAIIAGLFPLKKTVARSRLRESHNHISVSVSGDFQSSLREAQMQSPPMSIKLPTGLSFDIPDLMLLKGWSDFHEIRMTIELDACTENEEYEEILALHDPDGAFRRWTLWRSGDGIVVQPAMGRSMLFDRMVDALDCLIPTSD
jgi:hypothetical protein